MTEVLFTLHHLTQRLPAAAEMLIDLVRNKADMPEGADDAALEWPTVVVTRPLADGTFLSDLALCIDDSVENHLAHDLVEEFLRELRQEDGITEVIKYQDSYAHHQAGQYYQEIYHLEMELRKIISFIIKNDGKKTDKSTLEIFGVKLAPESEKAEEQFENKLFYTSFKDYILFEKPEYFSAQEMSRIIQNVSTFEDFRSLIQHRWLKNESHLSFIASLKDQMESIEKMRNAVAHSRAVSRKVEQNYKKSKLTVDKLIKDFWVSQPNIDIELLGKSNLFEEITFESTDALIDNFYINQNKLLGKIDLSTNPLPIDTAITIVPAAQEIVPVDRLNNQTVATPDIASVIQAFIPAESGQHLALQILEEHNLTEPFYQVLQVIQVQLADLEKDIEMRVVFQELIHIINHQIVGPIQDIEEKQQMKALLSQMVRAIIWGISQQSHFAAGRVVVELRNAIDAAAYIYEYDADELHQLLNLDAVPHSTSRFLESLEVLPASSGQKLQWLAGEQVLERVAYLLHEEYGCIKTKHDFIRIFKNKPKPCRWHPAKIDFLAHLLYCLYQEAHNPLHTPWFAPLEGKGYFEVAQGWFVDYSENSLPQKLKRRSSAVNNAPDKYQQLMSDIQSLMQDAAQFQR